MLSSDHPLVSYDIGATRLLYTRCPRTGIVEFSCLPLSRAGDVVPQRPLDTGPHITHLPARWQPRHAHEPEWLTPFKSSQSPEVHDFMMNRSMRSNADLWRLRFESHQASRHPDGTLLIETRILSENGIRLVHRVRWQSGDTFFRVSVEAANTSASHVTIDYLPSFSLGRLTPFDPGEAVERLKLHRFRAVWSAEGRHEARLLEDLNLERS